jgi:uncharacterized membrane protein
VILPRGFLVLAIVAILSVALNLFLVGNQLGHHFRPTTPVQMTFEQRLHAWWRDMPPADQTIAENTMDQHLGEILEKWRAFRVANQHVNQILHTENFDPAEAKAAFDLASQRLAELRTVMQGTLIEIAQKVSPEGRKHIRAPGF